jgi:hypothetical protein
MKGNDPNHNPPPIMTTQKQTQKIEIKPKTIQNSLEISLDGAKRLISLEIDEIRYSLSSKYWRNKARLYPEYSTYKNEQKRLRELQEKDAPKNEIIEQIMRVQNAKNVWEEKARKELIKAYDYNRAKRSTQKEQENILAQENILLTPITE